MHSVGPSGLRQEWSSALNMGKSLLPPCTRDEPHTSKNVQGIKPGNGAIIAGGLSFPGPFPDCVQVERNEWGLVKRNTVQG